MSWMFPNTMSSLLLRPGGTSSEPLVISHRYVCPPPPNIYFNVSHHIMGWSLAPSLAFDQFTRAVCSSVSRGGCFVLINYLRTYLNTLLEVSHVDPLCLEELRHDVPEHKHTRSVKRMPDRPARRTWRVQWHSLLLAGRASFLVADLVARVRQVHLGV